jgi:hypothetical protein
MRIWPVGIEEIKREFGDPHPYIHDGGAAVSAAWPMAILSRLELPEPLTLSWDPTKRAHSIACHQAIKPALGQLLARIHDAGLWHELEPYGGCYCWRPKSSGLQLSTHCWGIAVDFRVATCQRGTRGDMPPAIVELFESEGVMWGGQWFGAHCDPQHLQFCSGY